MFQKVKNAVRKTKEKTLTLYVRVELATAGEMYVDTAAFSLLR